MQGVRGPGESDDAPLDEDDPLQVHGRLREVWRSWRKLPVVQQRKWGDKQLSEYWDWLRMVRFTKATRTRELVQGVFELVGVCLTPKVYISRYFALMQRDKPLI